jgi:hypothetical protein
MHFQIFSLFSLFSFGTLLAMALVIAHPSHPRTAILQTRDLIGGILGGGFEPVITASDIDTVNDTQTAATGGGFPVQTSTLPGTLRASTMASTVSSQATLLSQATISSQATPFITQTTTRRPSATSSAVSSTNSTTSFKVGGVAEAPATPPGEATEWKVIGIAVIVITFIATVILAITFFDSWWGFLRALVLGNKHNGGEEKLVPDWNKRSWEYDLANEDGHRYPTMASLESIVKTPEKSAGVNSSLFVTTRLSQHDFAYGGLTNSRSKQLLVRDASLRKAGIV